MTITVFDDKAGGEVSDGFPRKKTGNIVGNPITS